MGLRRWSVWMKLSVVALFFCFLTTFSAYGADQETLDRFEKIIKQQQEQIAAQQKALEQLQVEVEALKGQTATATVKAATDSPAAVKTGNPKSKVKLYGQVNKAVLFSNDGDKATPTWWTTTTLPPVSGCWDPSIPMITLRLAPASRWNTRPTPATWSARKISAILPTTNLRNAIWTCGWMPNIRKVLPGLGVHGLGRHF
jgi:hypothetical protein